MTTAQIRRWLDSDHPDAARVRERHLPLFLGHDFEVDHVCPKAWGGIDHPRNYALILRDANRHFRDSLGSNERFEYIGSSIMRQVQEFMRWVREASEIDWTTMRRISFD
jgi:hypothetical protein